MLAAVKAVIRPATPQEYAAVSAVSVEGFVAASSAYAQTLADTVTRARVAEVLVAVHEGAIVGSVSRSE